MAGTTGVTLQPQASVSRPQSCLVGWKERKEGERKMGKGKVASSCPPQTTNTHA